MRWCCAEFKELSGVGKVTLIGIRKAESVRRSKHNRIMKKKLIIDKCCNCPYYKRIVVKNKSLKAVCFGRNKVYYLLNDTEATIADDCPLETVEE